MAMGAFFIIGIYGIYYPLITHIALLQSERVVLHKQCDEIAQLGKNDQELSAFIELGKKNIADRAIDPNMREEHCHKRMLFILDTITQLDLILNTYGSCKEKDKEWYTKDLAHFDISGSMQKLMTFLETVKKSSFAFTFSQATIKRISGDVFQMGFDVGLVVVKK
jgi:hypothetical protein